MSRYKLYAFPITLIILFGFLGVVEFLSQIATANAAHGSQEMVIEADPSSIEADGISTSTITALLSNTTGPISNTLVTFTTTLGTIASLMSETDTNGITATLTSAQSSGTAIISATATISSNMQITRSTQVTFTSGAPTTITLTTEKEKMNVFDTNLITATLQDAYQNPVSSIPITFTRSLGQLSASTAATNENGVATVTLSTKEITGIAVVTGTIISNEKVISDVITISVELYQLYLPLISKPLIPIIALEANPSEILTNQSSTITAKVKDSNENPLSGQELFFESSVGTIAPPTGITNKNGIVTGTLTVEDNIIGTVRITSTVTGISEYIDIPISSEPTRLSLTEKDNWTYESPDGPQVTYQKPFILGNNKPSACNNGLPNPGDWKLTSKLISPPQGATQATVNVDFILKTFDRNVQQPEEPTEDYDFFKIEVQDQNGTTLMVKRYANQTEQSGCNQSPHLFKLRFNEPVPITQDNDLKIMFHLGNRLDRYYNTWIELSEVSIDWE